MEKNFNFPQLFNEKKYSEIIYIIDFELPDNKKNLSIINLLGVCRLLQNNRSREDVIQAIEEFKSVYTKEKQTETSSKAFRNFINAVADLYDFERSKENMDKAFKYFNEALDYFNKDESFFIKDEQVVLGIIRIYKRMVDMQNVRFYLGELIKRKHLRPLTISSFIYNNCFFDDWPQEKYLEYGRLLDKNLPSYNGSKLVPLSKINNKKITIGFLSADIRHNHSVTYFLKTIVDNYDKNKFSINLYLNHKKTQEDETTKYFIKNIDKSTYISSLKDEDVINLIRKDNVDIFIDLMGITSETRLALTKNRVAPIQVLWCGYCNTTGISQMDYILADPNLILETEKSLYQEKIINLPNIWNCHPGFNLERISTPSPFLKNKYITFGSFNNFSKINDMVVSTWAKILKSINNSKLILKTSNLRISNLLKYKFEKENIFDSIEFVPFEKDFKSHLNLYKKIDIALDTFPYNGVTTSFEAIWMGVPVLTMKGYNFNSRCGESINNNLDLNWLVSENKEDYALKARELSEKNDFLLDIRKQLSEKAIMSPLFDAKLFSSDFFNTLENLKVKL